MSNKIQEKLASFWEEKNPYQKESLKTSTPNQKKREIED
jgi:hypothetical protein